MARALLICHRHSPAAQLDDERIERLGARILPDNVAPHRPTIVRQDGVVSVVFNGGAAVRTLGASVLLGRVADASADWWTPGAAHPEGSYAIFRVAADRVELMADAAATRTIWYAVTDDAFIASSSQRAIVALLGDFRRSDDACAWMLSSGTLGPRHGWDERLQRVAPGARIALDRSTWRLSATAAPIRFVAPAEPVDEAVQRRRLQQRVDDAVATLDVDWSKWLVPLSGGVDSRGLAIALRRANPRGDAIRCVTWGEPGACEDPAGDAHVARTVADRLGVRHSFLALDPTTEPSDELIDRFLVAGEGRIASLSGYLDGFNLWKSLFEQGAEGIVRGDHVLGRKAVRSGDDVRECLRLTVLEDFLDERTVTDFGLPKQELPDELARAPEESLATWRDRLCQQFNLPAVLAALTDLKTAYVEVVNPLLYFDVVEHTHRLPDELRTGKRLWRDLVHSWLPDVELATKGSVTPLRTALAAEDMTRLMLDELGSARASSVLGPAALEALRRRLEPSLTRPGAFAAIAGPLKARWTAGFKRRARRHLQASRLHLDPFVLGFRALIVSRMCALLQQDAAALQDRPAAEADTRAGRASGTEAGMRLA